MFSLIYNTENIYISYKPKVIICNVKQIKIVAKIYLGNEIIMANTIAVIVA